MYADDENTTTDRYSLTIETPRDLFVDRFALTQGLTPANFREVRCVCVCVCLSQKVGQKLVPTRR